MLKALLVGMGIGLIIVGLAQLLTNNSRSAQSCTAVQILAIGGCDSDGLCGVVAGTQEREIIKGKMRYPVAGLIDCRESISE